MSNETEMEIYETREPELYQKFNEYRKLSKKIDTCKTKYDFKISKLHSQIEFKKRSLKDLQDEKEKSIHDLSDDINFLKYELQKKYDFDFVKFGKIKLMGNKKKKNDVIEEDDNSQ